MMRTERTDVHRPLVLVTEDYDYVGYFDNEAADLGNTRHLLRQSLSESQTARYGTGDQCDHCGARIRYVAVLRHLPTGDHIAVGEQCLGNRFGRATADFHQLRKAAELMRKDQRIVKLRERTMADPRAQAIVAEVEACRETGWTPSFLESLVWQIDRKGGLSERQLEAGAEAAARSVERRARQASEAERRENEVFVAAPVTNDRQTVRGEVLAVKGVETDFGYATKLLLRVDAEGGCWKLWVTRPSTVLNAEGEQVGLDRGDRVQLTVRVKVSNDDATFAFGSRPTNARLLEGAVT